MTARMCLPDRRAAETVTFEFAGLRYVVTIGRYPDGSLAEAFFRNHKNNSAADVNARDAGIPAQLVAAIRLPGRDDRAGALPKLSTARRPASSVPRWI